MHAPTLPSVSYIGFGVVHMRFRAKSDSIGSSRALVLTTNVIPLQRQPRSRAAAAIVMPGFSFPHTSPGVGMLVQLRMLGRAGPRLVVRPHDSVAQLSIIETP